MSDDSTADQQRAQSNHALEIKMERKVTKDTGLNRNQIRQALHKRAGDFVEQVNAKPVRQKETDVESTRETKHSRPQILPALPFSVTNKSLPAVSPTDATEIGSRANPYEMGENRTTTDPTAANDTWTRAGGPSPSGGGPYDSVVTTNPRLFNNGDGTGFIYFRRMLFDSTGVIHTIGAEEAHSINMP